MARHACELSGRIVIDRALSMKSVVVEPVTLLGMKCEVIYQNDSYLSRVSDEYDNKEIGVPGSCAAATVLSLRTWYDYGSSASSPFVTLVCEDTNFELGCALFRSNCESDCPDVGVDPFNGIELIPADLTQDMQSVIDALPTWVQLHFFASMVAAVIEDSSDPRLTNVSPSVDYIGNPGRLIDFCGEPLGLLRLLNNGHVNIELLADLSWACYIRKTHNQINGHVTETRYKRDGITVPIEFIRPRSSIGSTLWRSGGRFNVSIEEIIANMRVARDDGDFVDRLIEADAQFYAEQMDQPFEFDAQQPNAVVRGIRG